VSDSLEIAVEIPPFDFSLIAVVAGAINLQKPVLMTVFQSKADVPCELAMSAHDPNRTFEG
jgi:hypothetical protein